VVRPVRGFSSERSDDVTALSQRVRDSFIGRSILRFVVMEGFDRSIILSAQVFTALIPLFIIVASVAPAGQEDVIGEGIIKRFALTGASADAVEQLFKAPAAATSSVTLFSALLLIYSGVAFTRRLQRMYRAAWGREQAGIRSALFATLGLVALVLEFLVAYGIREFTTLFPFEWLWAIPISLVTGLVLWTSIPYLLLERQLHWRRLLVAGAAAAVGMTIFAIGTPIYMPDVMTRATNEFGLFGVTITLIGWLLAASFVLVATTAIGAEFDSSNAPWLVRLKIRFGLVDPGAEAPVTIATERLGLTSDDLAALTRVLVNWLIMIAAVWIATAVVPGIVVNGGLGTYLAISLLFGLVNAVLGPVLYWLAGSQSWLRLGGSAVIVNGILFAATAGLSPNLDIGGLGGAVLGALVVAVASTLLELVFRPIPEGPSSSI
jgi:membrane protein